ncbi:MAG: hypothetical protein OXN27_22135 [Candidatus Poribacteria bacterium]|nr:hypothetical protein [Candidatus Poribacteria bacterium]
MKTLKISKKDKEGFTQSRGEMPRKGFTGNISICLDDAFHQSTRYRKDDLGEERRRILYYLNGQTNQLPWGLRRDRKVFVGAEISSPIQNALIYFISRINGRIAAKILTHPSKTNACINVRCIIRYSYLVSRRKGKNNESFGY